ncbi:MAG TPA: high-affinity nickel-transport family protein [Methylomirabilota bacterium]|jgi:high-affinity nickel-transport protein|nr:high-affinity nickel-transport family protein [Methylomirabilota bacterium]
MLGLLTVVLLGFFLGMRHATDPDHVIAVGTIVSRQRTIRGAVLVGLLWGVGHGLTILVVGSAIVLFGLVIPPRLGLGMELGVAFVLIGLGLWTLRDVFRSTGPVAAPDLHSHPHGHGVYVHEHPHGHGPGAHGHLEGQTLPTWLDRTLGRAGLARILRPVLIGLVHGLAGSAAVALLVLATIRHPLWAVAYLLVFGLGTIAGMMLITTLVAVPFAYSARRLGRANRGLAIASGVLSLAFGGFLAYQLAFVG